MDTNTVRPRLGIIGEGQLARMLALAAAPLGIEVQILGAGAQGPAIWLAKQALSGNCNDPAQLQRLAVLSDVLTLENEFVDAGALRTLEQAGHTLFPTAGSVALVQDKLTQKETLSREGLPLPAFRAIASPGQLHQCAAEWGWPVLLKARRNGYDGKGNITVRGAEEVGPAWERLRGEEQALYAEAYCAFQRELAVVVTTGRDGSTVCYPLVETVQQDHVCHLVRAPARLPAATVTAASRLACEAVAAVGAVGSFAVEMFLMPEQTLLINELAPRVHNSGHYSIEACHCSQFENHVRAVMGWPLGDPDMHCRAAVMVNILGQGSAGPGHLQAWSEALAVPGVHLHDYGKEQGRWGRKMGHLTVIGDDPGEVEQRALQAAALLCPDRQIERAS